MRLFGAVMMIAGMVWMVAGCGSAVRVGAMATSALVLADSMTASRFNLSVADGAATLTAVSGVGAAVSDAELIDSVTGARYSLGVRNGALTLAADPAGSGGTPGIGLADTVTAKTYELGVASGALTLAPAEKDAQ